MAMPLDDMLEKIWNIYQQVHPLQVEFDRRFYDMHELHEKYGGTDFPDQDSLVWALFECLDNLLDGMECSMRIQCQEARTIECYCWTA